MNERSATAALRTRLGAAFAVHALGASGFCATLRAERGADRLFVKLLPAAEGERLRAEAEGLRALAATSTIRVPRVVDCGDADGWTLLALEWLDFASPDGQFGARLGERLAALHRATPPHAGFGWPRDTWLGGTRQDGALTGAADREHWIGFVIERRLRMLTRRLDARVHASLIADVEAAIAVVPDLFDDGYVPRPSLIHGDLWSGNWGMLADGSPVIFDPAVSVSDAEAELAMMELFGAPPGGFFAGYRAVAGLATGYDRRRALYQLYHLLNHVLLFGAGYVAAVRRCVATIRAGARR